MRWKWAIPFNIQPLPPPLPLPAPFELLLVYPFRKERSRCRHVLPFRNFYASLPLRNLCLSMGWGGGGILNGMAQCFALWQKKHYQQILCRFQKQFFQGSKKWYTPSILRCFWPCQVDRRSVVLPLEDTYNSIGCHFFHTSFKGTAPKVLWVKGFSRRKKELKSDPRLCPLLAI